MGEPKEWVSQFVNRHIGPSDDEVRSMLSALGLDSLDQLVSSVAPKKILATTGFDLPKPLSEAELLEKAKAYARQNKIHKSFIGLGYYNCHVPQVIARNIFENPAWYTAYTPYQAEISQGRLEALLNFQTLVMDLTGLEIANASLLDEGTAAAEAMTLAFNVSARKQATTLWVDEDIFPQTLAVLKTRAEAMGIHIQVGKKENFTDDGSVFAVCVQYPAASGKVDDPSSFFKRCQDKGILNIAVTDLMALCVLKSPGSLGADIAVGSAQRFGVPLGFGGPHAGFMATRDAFKRFMPGRIVGVSRDGDGDQALRLALQTREQHIRREKATSNICTAQVLLAVMASMYAVYHGPRGLREIAMGIHRRTAWLAGNLEKMGFKPTCEFFFDTLRVRTASASAIYQRALDAKINLARISEDTLGVSLDETTTDEDVIELIKLFAGDNAAASEASHSGLAVPPSLIRGDDYLKQKVFNSHHSETQMLRYIHSLQGKDLSLTHSMIPLGSCTMKLNATTEMVPVTWPEFAHMHPFAPRSQAQGYLNLIHELGDWLCKLTGFDAVSFQPNAGSQGEYAGLLVIRSYHEARGDKDRKVCLIPTSAHGTNPASAVMAGLEVVAVACDSEGNIDIGDLTRKTQMHRERLAALMVTYPSTHGVFEEGIMEACRLIHDCGGLVYMDGANMNALTALARPKDLGADVCHLNLHKTFCIPHGGGGPGMGPIAVAKHLAPHLPNHVFADGKTAVTAVSSAPFGSASILPISWGYIAMMGESGLRKASSVAILNANYIAKKLSPYYDVVYKNSEGWVAHECIVDIRKFKECGITVDDVAKRLIDFGFHAPTMSWPVAGTLMIEPTESESKEELDRFVDAMITIRQEIAEIENGSVGQDSNVLKNAPHTLKRLVANEWNYPYSREKAAFPRDWVRSHKFWPAVSRIDNAFGDRNLVCSCVGFEF